METSWPDELARLTGLARLAEITFISRSHEFSITPNRAIKHCLRQVIKILNAVLNVSNWRVRTVEKSIPPHRAAAFIWKIFISPDWDPGRINRDLGKAGWLTFHMNLIYFYKSFLTIARSRLSEPARSTGPARLHMNSP